MTSRQFPTFSSPCHQLCRWGASHSVAACFCFLANEMRPITTVSNFAPGEVGRVDTGVQSPCPSAGGMIQFRTKLGLTMSKKKMNLGGWRCGTDVKPVTVYTQWRRNQLYRGSSSLNGVRSGEASEHPRPEMPSFATPPTNPVMGSPLCWRNRPSSTRLRTGRGSRGM